MAKTIELEFQGYWRESNKGGLPEKSGIYNVYSCVFNERKSTVTLKSYIYTGESNNVRARVADHEKLDDWERHLKVNEQLCYSFANVSSVDRVRAEAAVIYEHKPPENTEFRDSFPYETTTMKLEGQIALLNSDFTVYKKS